MLPVEVPVRLGGYQVGLVAQAVESLPECNVIALDSPKSRVLLISLDLLYVGAPLRKAIEEGVAAFFKPSQIFVTASHTHYAPMTDPSKPALGEYGEKFVARAGQLITQSVLNLMRTEGREVEIQVAHGTSQCSVNRRARRWLTVVDGKPAWKRVTMQPNYLASVDRRVGVLRFVSRRGVEGYLWTVACHPVSLPLPVRVSTHFPGVGRDILRAFTDSGDRLPVVFLQGFAGDLRPPAFRPSSRFTNLVAGRRFGVFETDLKYHEWAREILGWLETHSWSTSSSMAISANRREYPKDLFVSAAPAGVVSFHAVRLGDVLLVGSSAEVLSSYSVRVRALAPSFRVWPVGYIDDVFGYAPTRLEMDQGGYEVSGFCAPFSVGALKEDFETKMVAGFREVVGGIDMGDVV